MGVFDQFLIHEQPVTSAQINSSLNYIGFYGDIIFDSAVAVPSPTVAPVAPSGLTATGWTVGGNVINSGPGTLKILRSMLFPTTARHR